MATAFSAPCDDGIAPAIYDDHFREQAVIHNVDWCDLKSMTKVESNFHPEAISHKGAVGFCQAMPKTWAEWVRKGKVWGKPTNPRDCIRFMAVYLRWQMDYWEKRASLEQARLLAQASYNAGRRTVIEAVKSAGGKLIWTAVKDHLPTETIGYVAKITGVRAVFRRLNPFPRVNKKRDKSE